MKAIAYNGSPRKNWNTAQLLQRALEGAASQGAETKLYNLYDIPFTGCKSCFACKLKDGASYGKCAVKDGLEAILAEAAQADALIIGSPVYFGQLSGMTRSFIERLLFPYLVYAPGYPGLFTRKVPVGMIYTMNVNDEDLKLRGYEENFRSTENVLARTFGACESLYSTDTYQFEDYSKYEVTSFDPEKKAARRREHFPLDLEKAYTLGRRLAGDYSEE